MKGQHSILWQKIWAAGEMDPNLLAVPEQSVLVLANLDGGAAKLDTTTSATGSPTPDSGLPFSKKNPAIFRMGPGSPYRGDQHPVASLHAHGQPLALLVQGAGADGEDLALVELLDARLGQEDAGRGLGLGLDALDQDAVQEGHERLDGSDGGGLFRGGHGVSVKKFPLIAFPVAETGRDPLAVEENSAGLRADVWAFES